MGTWTGDSRAGGLVKKLINGARDVVPEMVTGLVLGNPGISLLDGYGAGGGGIDAGGVVAVRSDVRREVADAGRVAVISGGGAGHEPAHAGYVGPGMLSAAVSGDVFTSPATDAVLAAIRASAGPAGALLVVKNYTGDRLNFGLAAELAIADGIPVETVVVADDVALAANVDNAGRRGIAGTVFVHKVAGAAAAAGLGLAEVAAQARAASDAVGSMGIALTPCTVPAAGRPGFDLGDDEVELGLGIHGEPGVSRVALGSASEVTEALLSRIVADRGLGAGDRVALLVNNLGGTPAMELNIMLAESLRLLAEREIVVERAWAGGFLTALEMAGCSLSVLPVDDQRLAWLDAPTATPGWPAHQPGTVRRLGTEALADDSASAGAAGNVGNTDNAGPVRAADPGLTRALDAVCTALLAAEPELTEMDRVVGDGDLGISMARGAEAIRAEFPTYSHRDAADDVRALSGTLRRALGGSSGPLYAVLVLRAANVLGDRVAPYRPADWADAFAAGVAAISELGGARVGDRTMVDALVPAAEALTAAYGTGDAPSDSVDVAAGLRNAVEAAERGTASTADLDARLGRSSYLGDRAKGFLDPGAEAVVRWLRAIATVAIEDSGY